MKANVVRFHSPDVPDLARHRPVGDYGFLLQVMVGPEGGDGEEAFDLIVCTPGWLAERYVGDGFVFGLHKVIVLNYDWERLKRLVTDFVAAQEAETWEALALRLGRLGRWEFEDYQEYSG